MIQICGVISFCCMVTGTKVDTVVASDADAGVNAQIKYKIQRGAFEDFLIEPETGVIKVANHLDFDRRRIYNIEIIAVDGGIYSRV